MSESEFKIHAGDVNAAIIARRQRAPVRRPGLVSWLVLVVFAVMTAGSVFVAMELPTQIPRTPSTPLLRQLCERMDCDFLSRSAAPVVLGDLRLSGVVMRAAQRPGALVFNAVLVNTAAREQPWPALVFTLFDGGGQRLEKRRVEGRDYATRERLPVNTPLAVEIMLDPAPATAAQYSVTPALPE